jgi:hypothetical protein
VTRALILAALALAACRRDQPAPPPVLTEIEARVARTSPPGLLAPDEAALRAAVVRAVDAVPGPMRRVEAPPPRAPAARLAVELELGWQPEGVERGLRSVVRARLRPNAAGSSIVALEREALVQKEEVPRMPSAAEVNAHVDHALGLVVGGVMRAEQLWLGPPAAARAALDGSDEDVRDEAIRIAGERRDREAVPALIVLLKHKDVDLRDRAIGALAEIGDPRAARPLADLAKFSEVMELPKILDAISRVGGPEAETFLDFVAASHPIPQVREIARRAKEHASSRPARR